MKILVFNGSPKRQNSDTMHITRAFIEGMKSVRECSVTEIDVYDKNIKYCSGCLSCMRNGGKCVIDDDMSGILDQILESDILLFSFPLYCYGMPAALKALIDRTLPLSSIQVVKKGDHYEHVAQRDFSKIFFIMICGCGFPNSKHNFDAMIDQFQMMFHDNSEIITVSESPMFNAPQADIVTAPFLQTVARAGAEYAVNGVIGEDMHKLLSTPMIPDDVYAKIVNGEK